MKIDTFYVTLITETTIFQTTFCMGSELDFSYYGNSYTLLII